MTHENLIEIPILFVENITDKVQENSWKNNWGKSNIKNERNTSEPTQRVPGMDCLIST